MKIFALIFCALFAFSCAQPESAETVLEKAIIHAGSENLNAAEVTFIFRKKEYSFYKNGGQYRYQSIGTDSSGNKILDILSNQGFKRFIGDSLVELTPEKEKSYSNSLNSVIYFAFLPLWLKDSAVQKELVGTVTIKDHKYHKLKISFVEENGGEDFKDLFYYYFDKKDGSLDYLAYKYETDKGGIRFRVAQNPRVINGVLIQDYINLKPKDLSSTDFSKIEEHFVNDELTELSLITLEDVQVRLKP